MRLAGLIARLGIAEVARRLGVTARTVRRWDRQGVSARYAPKVDRVASRHVRSAKAAETRRRKFQESLPAPSEPYIDLQFPRLGQTLTPEQVLPTRKPRRSEEPPSERYQSSRYIGRIYHVSIDRPVLDVDPSEIVDIVFAYWLRHGTTFVWVEFLFFRYIPFNPIYKGELVAKQGTWDAWYSSTPARATSHEVERAIENVMDDAIFAAQRRMQWFSAIKIYLLDET